MRKVNNYSSETVLEDFYRAFADGNEASLRRVHIPRSDVFYIRAAIEADTGVRYTLDRVERAMFLEGHLPKSDVLDPDRKRDWED
jgi:hypothetical protein